MPYIKLKVYGQTVLLDGGMAGMGGGAHGRIGPLDSPVRMPWSDDLLIFIISLLSHASY